MTLTDREGKFLGITLKCLDALKDNMLIRAGDLNPFGTNKEVVVFTNETSIF